jgi:D-alanyl-D-alanine carboxypeptidase
MTLRQKQSRFVWLVAQLIIQATARGYELTFGECYRSPEEARRLAKLGLGTITSLHCSKLAIDLNLFRDGAYLKATEDYQPLGEWWEQQSTADVTCCWGGRFARADGNHFSIAHGSRK